uniref:F-box domain-containing protein n=1 Tax=Oryza punctata TaxID=4537 RepID=A0A0E0LGH0_ORYPU
MAAPPELIDDLAAEILLRIPPDEPAHLVRPSLVCKPWRRILTDPAFLRRYRAFHRTPPVLGFLQTFSVSTWAPPSPTSSPLPPLLHSPHRPSIPPTGCGCLTAATAGSSPTSSIPWNNSWSGTPSPATSIAFLCPRTSTPTALAPCYALHAAATISTATKAPSTSSSWGVDLPVGMTHEHACTLTGQWSSKASIVLDSFVEMLPSLLAEDTLYFNCEQCMKILGYDIGRHELSEIDPPLGHDGGILMESEYGGLGFATVEACGLVLWSQYVDYDGIEEWEQSRVIELDMLIPNFLFSGVLVGFAEGTHTIFMLTDVGLFAIELKSGQVKKIGESRPYYAVIPYMSFYTSDLAGRRLAQPAGMHLNKSLSE